MALWTFALGSFCFVSLLSERHPNCLPIWGTHPLWVSESWWQERPYLTMDSFLPRSLEVMWPRLSCPFPGCDWIEWHKDWILRDHSQELQEATWEGVSQAPQPLGQLWGNSGGCRLQTTGRTLQCSCLCSQSGLPVLSHLHCVLPNAEFYYRFQ